MTITRTIFLAEDDPDDQEFLQEALLAIDPSVHLVSFSNGLKFLDQLNNTPDEALPGLIILDYNIPEINGAEILAQLNQNNRYAGINKIIWSTSGSDRFKKSCLDLGAKDYLIKPTSLSGIKEIAEKFVQLV